MKLSLTAIAALFAATLHPSLAAGTRAASSNINTNAAEEKPDRDLDVLKDISESLGYDLGDGLDAIKSGVAAESLVDLMQIDYVITCMLGRFGHDFATGSVSAWRGIPLKPETQFGWLIREARFSSAWGTLQEFAGNDEIMSELEMWVFFMSLPDIKLSLIVASMKEICAAPGWYGSHH